MTLLFGIALNLASVFTVVLALGLVDWPAVVLVSLLARLRPLPFASPLPAAVVLLVVPVFWLADVLWLVVALGLIVTLLCGIALNRASVLVVVFAVGAVDWPAVVLVLLPAVLLCADTDPAVAAKTAAAIRVTLFLSMRFSSIRLLWRSCSIRTRIKSQQASLPGDNINRTKPMRSRRSLAKDAAITQ
ncbi:MAG TPA: hypothetical protein VD867_13800 [Burkholderiales bacterium]|nr:hypothetical protein [Burkholderiales bacterium]